MKGLILVGLLVVAVSASFVEEHAAKFQDFKLKHGKTYSNQVEETKRFAIFKDNLRSIEEHNALYEQGITSWKQGITKFADWTHEEFKAKLTLQKASKPKLNATKKFELQAGVTVPASVDWRAEGQVTGIKDQGQCGSCWAFSVVGSTEGAYFRHSGKLVSLSEQQLVDCSTSVGNAGCDGGYLDYTFPYIERYGIQSEASYPYLARDAKCNYDASEVVTKVSDYVSISENENALLQAVGTVGPVSVSIDATYLSLYDSGVYSDNYCTKDELNHGVLIVGYGTESGRDYWLVKNSWGTSFGEAGYVKMQRGVNQCGITEDDVYPIIN